MVLLLLAGGVEGVGRDDGAAAGVGGDLLREVAQVGAVRGVDVRLLTVAGEEATKT